MIFSMLSMYEGLIGLIDLKSTNLLLFDFFIPIPLWVNVSGGAGIILIMIILVVLLVAGFFAGRYYALKGRTNQRGSSHPDAVLSDETFNYLKSRFQQPLPAIIPVHASDELNRHLKSDRNNFYSFAQMSSEIVFECDREGNLLFLNTAGFEMLGVNVIDLPAKNLTVFNFLHPDDREVGRENLRHYWNNLNPEEFEYRVYYNDKVLMRAKVFGIPVLKQGELKAIRGFLVDVSQRRKNEESIQTLEDIVSHVGLGINVYSREDESDAMNFRLEMINDAAARIFSFCSRKNIGKSIGDVSAIYEQKGLHKVFHEVSKTEKFKEIDNFIYQPDPSKHASHLKLRIFPLPNKRVLMLIEDNTAMKLEELNLKMTSFGIENAGDIILWLDEKAHIIFANGTASRTYGYSKEKLMGMTIADIDARITMVHWYELVQILESKSSLVMESINKTSEGENFPVELSINKFVFDGKNNYFAFVRDISDRKKNDELEQKIQVARKSAAIKQQFLANMSHEIRTPMTGIMGMTSLLTRTNLSPAQQEYVRNIKISSENLLNIINDVLDLSKIEAGKMELKPNRIAFRDFVNDIKEMFQHQAQNKGIKFTTGIDSKIPPYIIIDDQRLKQVINNLLSNAFKFTDEGEISIIFSIESVSGNFAMLRCNVSDTGMGISDYNQKQVFEKFTQVDTSLIRPFEGTGLGLAICRELTQLMGGEISVTSELDKGSTFSFTFRAEFDQQAVQEQVTDTKKDELDLKINVLHVEDKLLNQKVVGFILFNAGCNVDFVKNGREAIDNYTPGKYDVILMDIQMPVMDGISAYQELKRIHGDKLCPVIGLSANALEGDAQKFMALGLDDYIVKPFQPAILYEKLQKWTGKKNKSAK
jgi:PAS domain S-box-containing protein